MSGRVGDIYRYLIKERAEGYIAVFLDCRSQISNGRSLLFASIIIEAVSLIAVFLPVALLSGHAIRPVAESIEKQKQFITDAGHEIKTPLAIISANTEVIEMTSGESEWLTSIKKQTARLGKLTEELVMLSKLEEEHPAITFTDFSLSDAVFDAAASFRTVAECAGKTLDISVEPGVSYRGDEGSIRRLVSLLVDNAVKYSDKPGEIRLVLRRSGKDTLLEVSNPCVGFDEASLPRLFDRFYRADESRSRQTGGYGIGLAVAKAICEVHRAEITARYDRDRRVVFTVTL